MYTLFRNGIGGGVDRCPSQTSGTRHVLRGSAVCRRDTLPHERRPVLRPSVETVNLTDLPVSARAFFSCFLLLFFLLNKIY